MALFIRVWVKAQVWALARRDAHFVESGDGTTGARRAGAAASRTPGDRAEPDESQASLSKNAPEWSGLESTIHNEFCHAFLLGTFAKSRDWLSRSDTVQ